VSDKAQASVGQGQALYRKAKALIPGGTQLLSKRPEMHLPGYWPAYYAKARGAEVWDLDGNRYVEMGYAGLGSCVLGYADAEVNDAVMSAVRDGSMCTLNCPEEVELAELLIELHSWAKKVRYARTGGEAMAMAVRIARAATGRDRVAMCGYHGWHDWYLSANWGESGGLDGHLLPGLAPAGVPRSLQGTAMTFRYNQIEGLKRIVELHGSELAAVVMEPIRSTRPLPGFLEEVKGLAERVGAVLIFDEVTSGWRFRLGGMHLELGVEPQIAVFAKGMSNGFPMAAVIGTDRVMGAAQGSFISSTYWTDRVGPAAALATIRKLKREGVPRHLKRSGERVQAGWREAGRRYGVPVQVGGLPALSHFSFEVPNAQATRTLFTQLMLDRGYLAGPAYYAMLAQGDAEIEGYVSAVGESFGVIAGALKGHEVERMLRGPVAHTGFHRLT
jgi:glutamate-1-semialdehyde aminotransferase